MKSIIVPQIDLGPISQNDFEISLMIDDSGSFTNILGMNLLINHKCSFLIDQSKVIVDLTLIEEENIHFNQIKFEHSIPFIEVKFEGAKLNSLWDTGTSMSVVSESIFIKYPNKFRKIDVQSIASDMYGVKKEIPLYYMESIEIGGQLFPEQMVAVMDLSHFNEYMEQPIDLILGYNTICKANWIFDFPNNKWAILKMLNHF